MNVTCLVARLLWLQYPESFGTNMVQDDKRAATSTDF